MQKRFMIQEALFVEKQFLEKSFFLQENHRKN